MIGKCPCVWLPRKKPTRSVQSLQSVSRRVVSSRHGLPQPLDFVRRELPPHHCLDMTDRTIQVAMFTEQYFLAATLELDLAHADSFRDAFT